MNNPGTAAPAPTPQQIRHDHLQSFYAILGKVLGLAIVGTGAYQQSQLSGASSLLKPENLANLIAGVQMAVAAAVPDPAV